VVIPFAAFRGELPRLAAWELPEGYAQQVVNVDLMHGDLRGLRANAPYQATALSAAPRAVYTEDGTNYFAWPYEAYPVKSMVVGDIYHRVYYTAMLSDGPIIKVARTVRDTGVQVAGGQVVGGNFKPPENSNGPDSWVLGVPAPLVQNLNATDPLAASLADKAAWPGSPNLQLRVTFFIEDPSGKIVFQQTINNAEAAVHPNTGVHYPQVLYTNDPSQRGNKVQDMLWPLGYTPRPYKYYWYTPPDTSLAALSRTVTVLNTDPGGANIVITYGGGTTPDPNTGVGVGTDGNEA
jgi:hypothetical protein